MTTELEQLRADLMYLARRQKALEDAISEWSEFITRELLNCGIRLHKRQVGDHYFRESLKDKFKSDYEKFETLFKNIKPKKKYAYDTIKEENNNV